MYGISHDARWREKAACSKEDPELFFPTGVNGYSEKIVDQAKAICRTCPVADECLSYAMDHDEDYGIWGGLTENQRRDLKRRAMRERRYRMYGNSSYKVEEYMRHRDRH